MPTETIQWFPGHMAKTRRLISENLSQVDLVIEVRDARIPVSSENPEILRLAGTKPLMTVLNKSGMADPAESARWIDTIRQSGRAAVLTDCVTGSGFSGIEPEIRRVLADKLARYRERGMEGKRLRAMVVGIPNVGKSSFINRMSGGRRAKVENRPGVTLAKQWITAKSGIDLMDMPGVLWPKFNDRHVAENLAFTGAIKDDVLQIEEIAMLLADRLRRCVPDLLSARYTLTPEEMNAGDAYDLLLTIGRHRGMMMAGGCVNERRTADMLLDEFRAVKIGRITLEAAPRGQNFAANTPSDQLPQSPEEADNA